MRKSFVIVSLYERWGTSQCIQMKAKMPFISSYIVCTIWNAYQPANTRNWENMPREGNWADPYFNTVFQLQPRFPRQIPKTLSSEARPGNEWRITMTKRSAHPPYFMQGTAGGGNDRQSCVGNTGMGLRTLKYQTNETEQLLEEKAISAFKDAVEVHGRAGH